jgi:hypothetical protein
MGQTPIGTPRGDGLRGRQRGRGLLEVNVDGEDTGARRFYERHGYLNSEPGEVEPLLYYYRELKGPAR